jgi:hypothetical protein
MIAADCCSMVLDLQRCFYHLDLHAPHGNYLLHAHLLGPAKKQDWFSDCPSFC